MCDFNAFPYSFRSKMEDVLFREIIANNLNIGSDLNNVYYPSRNQRSINKEMYCLSTGEELTYHDLEMIKVYVTDYIVLLESCTRLCNNDKRLTKETNRVKEVFNHF